MRIPNICSIAAIDPSGGAGSFADLKTFSALGGYGAGVVVALTAQNTRAVTGIHEAPVEFSRLQIDTLFEDVRIDAVKIGALVAAPIIRMVAERLRHWQPRFVVLDPVMVAKSGDRLLREDAVQAMREELLPLATVVTPNLPEAGDLVGREVTDAPEDMRDRFIDLPAERIRTKNTHGTGCTLSSAIAALLPQRPTVEAAVRDAREYVLGAIRAADQLQVGGGHGPLHHFHSLWR
jgi:hydroxymethylpyrimidine/phosphomethylpyrimidine kinase